jgi:hypothetical protein
LDKVIDLDVTWQATGEMKRNALDDVNMGANNCLLGGSETSGAG